ncbi:MAG: methyl-accepting chemotaxis protein [Tepidamorphaceae bacterium]
MAFGLMVAISIISGQVNHRISKQIGDNGIEAGEKLAPLGDAAMEIKLSATHAHLLFEEIMSGDDGESIDEVWKLLDETRFYVNAILNGGSNDEGTFYPSEDPLVREKIAEVQVSVDAFIEAAKRRYARRADNAGAGSADDEAFDQTFESFIALADEAEELIHDDMDLALINLHASRKFADTAQIVSTLVMLGAAIAAGLFLSKSLAGRTIQLSVAARELAAGNTATELPKWSSKDELGELKGSLESFRASLIEQQSLQKQVAAQDQQQAAERKRLLGELAMEFQASTETCFRSLEDASGGLQSAIRVMSEAVRNSSDMVGATTEAAGGASANVGTVAAAAEELSASIGEISRQVSTTAQVVDTAASRASATSEKISNLAEAVEKIGQVVTLIQEIAEQTNLLALNATIEAARAGEMGRGFAVVASEVKELATQTAKATDEIGGHIAAIQESTKDAVHAIREITGTMSEIETNTSSISSAVDQQGSATQEIATNAQATSAQTDQVSRNMSSMSDAVGTVNETTEQVRQSSANITASTADLRKSMADFMARLNAA